MTTIQQTLSLNWNSVLNVDLSNFGSVTVLAAALQTRLAEPYRGYSKRSPATPKVSTLAGHHARHKAPYQAWKMNK
jgi:hypothetical protein